MPRKPPKPDRCIPVKIPMPTALVSAIDKKAGERGRAQFVRLAVAIALGRPGLAEVRKAGRPRKDGEDE